MATWEDVGRIALVLPETGERRTHEWTVKDKLFVWERPLRQKDLEALGDAAPDGQIVALRVADEGEKAALVGDEPGSFFTTPHFDGYPIVLALLEELSVPELEELIEDAWLARAPKRLANEYLAGSQ